MPPTKRYYSADDTDVGVTPSRFKKLSRVRQLAYMQRWFETYFEDPSNQTPREDGEFEYIWGGPYDASDELNGEFGGLVNEGCMEEAVKMIEADGTIDWAPTSTHPDYQASLETEALNDQVHEETIDDVLLRLKGGLSISFGSPEDLEQRAVVLRHLDALRSELGRLAKPTPGRGHNNPPPDDDEAPSAIEVEAAIADISTELDRPEPDVVKVAEAASRISRAGKWLRARFDKSVERRVEDAISQTETLLVLTAAAELPRLMHHVTDAVVHWIQVVGNLL